MSVERSAGFTGCLSKATLAAGTTTTVKTTGTTVFAIDGKAYSHAALSNAAAPTTDVVDGNAFTAVGVNQGSIFVHGFNSAGALKVAQGSVEDLDAGGNFVTAPRNPAFPDDFAPFGYLVVKVGATGSAWTYGSSNQSGVTGVTYTRQDIVSLPSRLQIA